MTLQRREEHAHTDSYLCSVDVTYSTSMPQDELNKAEDIADRLV